MFSLSHATLASGWGGLVERGAGAQSRSLAFYNTHTRETLDVTYWRNGRYDKQALEKINWILRDHRRGEPTNVSPDVLNYLHEVLEIVAKRHPDIEMRAHIISGYRSPMTNAALRAGGGGQAPKSRHMHGDAIDFRIPGVETAEIRDIAWCLQRGGVGYYRGSDFMHIDTHTVRHWNWSPRNGMCGNAGKAS